jgi:hypothetical protein
LAQDPRAPIGGGKERHLVMISREKAVIVDYISV